MGLKPGFADGPMPDCENYRPQCQHFLRRQIEIIRPSTIIVLGDDVARGLRTRETCREGLLGDQLTANTAFYATISFRSRSADCARYGL